MLTFAAYHSHAIVADLIEFFDQGKVYCISSFSISRRLDRFNSFRTERDEMQLAWASDPSVLSMEDSVIESHLCSEAGRFYVPSPPQLSPVAEKECFVETVSTPIVSPQADVCHESVQENLLLQPRERLVPNGYREISDATQSSLHPVENLNMGSYGALSHCVVLEEGETADASDADVSNQHLIEERVAAADS